MELELGLALALPSHNPSMIRGLDLNLDSDGSTTETRRVDYRPKRVFLKDHDAGVETATLSLLLWSGGRRRMDEDNGGDRLPKWRKLHVDEESSDDDCQVIEGWPPVNSSWKEHPRHGQGGSGSGSSTPPEQVRKSMHVKVKMEGVAIGRKVDLRHYYSYRALTNTLIDMFDKYRKMDNTREGYTLLYQDKEGDWMLVGDVQWEIFIESVQRIEILKSDNKMGFRLLSRKSRF